MNDEDKKRFSIVQIDAHSLIKFLPKMLMYVGLGLYAGWLVNMMLSRYDPDAATHFGLVGRTYLFERMLAIMSPLSWGFVFFILIIIAGIVGDPYWRRPRNLPEENESWHQSNDSLENEDKDNE